MSTEPSGVLAERTEKVWSEAATFRQNALGWVKDCKVLLEADPTQYIGRLHDKLSGARDLVNKVRDVVFESMTIMAALKTLSSDASDAYTSALNRQMQEKATDERFQKMKSKDERELFLRPAIQAEYDLKIRLESRIDEWEQFQKQVTLVYNDLANARRDIETQIAIIKQQMFKGEIKPNPDLGKLGSLAEVVGGDVRSFLEGATGLEPDRVRTNVDPAGGSGEVEWSA